ncbi:MAG: hypothetical protein DI586_01035 [Micavibrio aeruginosavorus]|uniref:Uncharacterized protein n=1 Tax=Micavibrio aeruginosavorus TaxID=349221 RepID=A0A2W5HG99_9BACT|nr:MAG: hypothetical protein DI586_01035 [Micavibrio aeruginosavorus]
MALSSTDIQLISDIFIRVSLYVSHADDTDQGEESEAKERDYMMKALARIVKLSKSPDIATAAKMALENNAVFEDESEESLSNAIREMVAAFKLSESEEGLLHLKRAVMFVATSVARAYREELDIREEEFLLEGLLNKIIGAINKEADPEEFKNINISPAEDSALTMISEALRAKDANDSR